MALPPGTRLGAYEVTGPLGAGGMGEVYRARDARLDRTVAIKVLPAELAADASARARFEREARAVAALDHPHICGIFDFGDANDTLFLVMPLLDGQTLAARLEKGPLPIEQALTFATQIADALDKAHRHGIVHRDIKPANIMLTKAGAMLLDFGLAKLKGPVTPISLSGMAGVVTTSPGTAQGTILGTVQYMAPEQVEGREADARSDIWALGAVLYEMITCARPFPGDTPASVIGAILKDTPPPISTRQPLAPRALDAIVERCLAKDPDERWQSVADLGRLLQWIASNRMADADLHARPGGAWKDRAKWLAVAALLLTTLGFTTLWRPESFKRVRSSACPSSHPNEWCLRRTPAPLFRPRNSPCRRMAARSRSWPWRRTSGRRSGCGRWAMPTPARCQGPTTHWSRSGPRTTAGSGFPIPKAG